MTSDNLSWVKIGIIFIGLFFLTGCPDPDKQADEIFKKQGLNRVRVLNDYMQPGSVVVVKGKKAVYADNMMDYVETQPDPNRAFKLQAGAAVIPSGNNQTAMGVDVALKFLDSLLPVKASGKIALSSDVKLELVNAKSKRLRVPDLQSFLNSSASKAFRDSMLTQMNEGQSVFIAYEIYLTNKLKLTANAGSDISASAEIGKINPLFESSEPKFTFTKKSKTEIVIDGDTYYVFGLKTAKLKFNQARNTWSFDVTNFVPTGVLAAGTDDKFATSLTGDTPTDFKSVDIQRRDPTKPER
jgi:hypothetical protein